MQSSPGERSGKFSQNGKFGQNGKFSQNGKLAQNDMSGQKGKVHLGPNVSSSAHYRGCVVNGSGAMAAISVLLLLLYVHARTQTERDGKIDKQTPCK